MQYEQPLGDRSPAEGLPSLASSKEAPSLPTKAPSYEAKRPAPKAQDRCASKRHPFYAETSMPTMQSATLYRQRKRSREIFAALVCEVTGRVRNESTVLHMIRVAPWRRGAPKAQDGCASKRHPSTQRPVCQLCKAPLRIVIGSEFEGSLSHSYASKCVGRETKARYCI